VDRQCMPRTPSLWLKLPTSSDGLSFKLLIFLARRKGFEPLTPRFEEFWPKLLRSPYVHRNA
jgi:hypothetical protein